MPQFMIIIFNFILNKNLIAKYNIKIFGKKC